MSEAEELRREIELLKGIVEKMQSTGIKSPNISSQLAQTRRKVFNQYFGKWNTEACRNLGNNGSKRWSDYEYLMQGLEKLTSVTYKAVRGLSGKPILSVVQSEADKKTYEAIYEQYTKMVFEKIEELSKGDDGGQAHG